MLKHLRDMWSPENRVVIGEEAKQALENRYWRMAFESVEGYLVEKAHSVDPDNKEATQGIVRSMQLLESLKRELHRQIEDGEVAKVQIRQIEQQQRPRVFRR